MVRPIRADSARLESLRALLQSVADEGVTHVAEGLSTFVGETILISSPSIKVVPLAELSSILGEPDEVGIGIYLALAGGLSGHVMLLLSRESALELVNLLLAGQNGPVTDLGPLERSALAEIGNLTASLFLTAVARVTGIKLLRPSPPAVIEDMVGAILDILAVAIGAVSEYALIMETDFHRPNHSASALFLLIPNFESLEDLVGFA